MSGPDRRRHFEGGNLRIRPYGPNHVDEAHLNNIWIALRDAIQALLRRDLSSVSFEMCYRHCYTMVLHKHGARLCAGVKELLASHVDKRIREDVLNSIDGTFSLRALNQHYGHYTWSLERIRGMLMYMDRMYIPQSNEQNVYDYGLMLFRDRVLTEDVRTKLRDTLLDTIARERSGGEAVYRSAIKDVCLMLLGFGGRSVYEEVLEKPFLKQAHEFFRREAEEYLASESASSFVSMVLQRIVEEDERAKECFDISTALLLRVMVEEEYIRRNMARVMTMKNGGVVYNIENCKFEDMAKMYSLFARVDGGLRTMLSLLTDEVRAKLRDTLLNMIARERSGEAIDRPAIIDACEILLQLGLYEEVLEKPFLNQSREFFRKESEGLLAVRNSSFYVSQALRRIAEETERAKQCFRTSTADLILEAAEEEFIRRNLTTVITIDSGGVVNKIEDSSGDPMRFVQAMIELKEHHDKLLVEIFSIDRRFEQMIATEFERILNLNPRAPEYLSLYVDDKLKKGSKDVTEAELGTVMDRFMTLLRFLQEKDVFERFYKQHLAKRLLFNRSTSEDSEKIMIGKLKSEFGHQFTQKLEGMFKDMALSQSLNADFKNFLSSQESRPAVELQMQVLTTGFWPMSPNPGGVKPSASLQTAFEIFKSFYLGKHSGRQLTLQTNLGQADMICLFWGNVSDPSGPPLKEPRKYILQVQPYHMILFLLFNDQPRWTFGKLLEATKIPEKELKRTIMSVLSGKQNLLLKEGSDEDIDQTTSFSVNNCFQSTSVRAKIKMLAGKAEEDSERQETRSKVEEDRKHEIEAAVVRIMKSRKKLQHNQLVADVIEQLQHRFAPSPPIIKKRIEVLIEREYLARDPNDRTMYSYVS